MRIVIRMKRVMNITTMSAITITNMTIAKMKISIYTKDVADTE